MRLGMMEEAKGLLRKNISLFEAAGVAQVVTACPDCSFGFREDYIRLIGDGERKPRFEVFDLIHLLPDLKTKKSQKVACHNSCYLSRQGIRLSDHLSKKGLKISEVIEDCCGAGGGVYFTNPELGQEIGRKTVGQTEAGMVITGCPFCKEQFEKVLGKEKKVIHYIELFGQ